MQHFGWREASYLLMRPLWAVILGMLILGALTGDYLTFSIVFLVAWLVYLFQDRLVFLPSAPETIQESVRELSHRLGIRPPAVYVYRSDTNNASAMSGIRGGAVIVNSGLLNLPQDEIDATLAHELAHIKNGDSLSTMGLLTVIALVGINVALGAADKWAVVAAVGLLPLVSWAQEFGADALGARTCGDPSALGRFLQRAHSYKRVLSSTIVQYLLWGCILYLLYAASLSTLEFIILACFIAPTLPTHPPTSFRIRRLNRATLASGSI